MVKFLDLHKQYKGIKTEIDQAIQTVISESSFIGGPHVASFEKSFSSYQNCSFCIGVGNGTDALEIAIEALDLEPGGEIIVPANSFIASAEAVTRAGYRVVFCDCNPNDYTISIEDLKKRISSSTVAIIAVHLYGHPCDMDLILEISKEHGLRVIEDCAQAHGAEYKGQKVGAIADIGTFSFYPGKNLGAYGDAGAIVTNDKDLARSCRMIANHGREEKYSHQLEGRNSRLDGLQAAVLNVKLKYLDKWTEKRLLIADFYLEHLGNNGEIYSPVRRKWAKQVYHLFVIRHSNRELLLRKLRDSNIGYGIHYPIALPKLKAYRYLNQHEENGFAWRSDNQLVSLPIGEHMDIGDAMKVIEALGT